MGAVLILVVSAIVLGIIQAKSIGEGSSNSNTNNGNGVIREDGQIIWHPGQGQNREEWLRCHGFSCEKWERTRRKLFDLKVASAGQGFDMNQMLNDTDDSLDNCIWLTEEQLDDILIQLEEDFLNNEEAGVPPGKEKKEANEPGKPNGKDRQKRKITDFQTYPFSMWEGVMYWKFDGSHTTSEKEFIRGAFRHWDAQTCVGFVEVPSDADIQDHHVLVTREYTGCHSFIGRIGNIPQQLNLQPECLRDFGTSVHEIGHALGMWHEQQRSDRDDHIKVHWENLGYYVGQFYKQKVGNTVNNVHYDYASVMHYGPKDGSKNQNLTMATINPLYQHIFGQRTGASYLDVKSVNLAYCQASCSNSLPQPCQHDGYQDPNDCSRCRCPPGLTGTYCDQVAPPKQANCGGEIILSSQSNTAILQTPGYDTPRYYNNYQECTWLIKAPPGSQVSLTFEGQFGLYCYQQQQCHHWVEVRYQKDIGLQGPRFCCYNNPGVVLTSDNGEMLVVFQANDTQKWTSARRGFKARVWTDGELLETHSCEDMDLIFTVDATMSESGFQQVLAYIINIIHNLKISPTNTRVGLVTFNDKATVQIPLKMYDNIADLEKAIKAVTVIPSSTNFYEGLHATRGEFLSNVRFNVNKICIFITDGGNQDKWQAIIESQAAKIEKVQLYMVGIGEQFDTDEAKWMTGTSDGVIHLEDYFSLADQVIPSVQNFLKCISTNESTASDENTNWACSFESKGLPLCDMEQETSGGDHFDWSRVSGTTPSAMTGPLMAQDGNYYIFIEASNPRMSNDRAVIYFPPFDTLGKHCVSFYYNMYGFHIRTLQLTEKTGTSRESTIFWERTGEVGLQWQHMELDVEIQEGARLSFVGITGDEYSGDIAVDNVHVTSGECNSIN